MASFLNSLGAFVQSKKDEAVSAVMRPLAQRYLVEYAEMLELSVNSHDKTIRVQALLKGETTPISITIDGYEFVTENGVTWLRFQGLSVSREWLNTLVKTLVTTDRIELPNALSATLLKLAL